MTLKQGKNNKTYQVLSINIELLLERRLEALGLTEGAKITISGIFLRTSTVSAAL